MKSNKRENFNIRVATPARTTASSFTDLSDCGCRPLLPLLTGAYGPLLAGVYGPRATSCNSRAAVDILAAPCPMRYQEVIRLSHFLANVPNISDLYLNFGSEKRKALDKARRRGTLAYLAQ
uniref:Uncharacterized protein n=1 Tax=Oryza rufipogon TaxID=4529 RepID=A0A0E0NN51_ORYRU